MTNSVNSFYHLYNETTGAKYCHGTACFVAQYLNIERWQKTESQTPRVYCLGKCFAAPSSSEDNSRPEIKSFASKTILLERIIKGRAKTLDTYLQKDGYTALKKAVGLQREEIVTAIEKSGLRGRGGAGFPAGKKMQAVFNETSREKYMVANADEGDPGSYSDRFLMEDDPFCFIEGMTIAALAVGAKKGYIYLRNEYPEAFSILEKALEEARRHNFLGEKILNNNFSFNIQLVTGKGSYVCGEETALLNSIEGKTPQVRARPPYPTQSGLWGKPTLVNNVETVANIPWIIKNGSQAYNSLGFSKSQGTKLISLNSLFNHPGLYEVEFGVTLRYIVEEIGGGLKRGNIKGVIIGGPLAGIIPPSLFDTPFGFEELRTIGATVGHGGIVAFDKEISIPKLVHHIFSFGAFESCGKCTPCRLGSSRIEEIFSRVLEKGSTCETRSEWDDIISAMAETSLCGLGTGLAEFAVSAMKHYPEEIIKCFK